MPVPGLRLIRLLYNPHLHSTPPNFISLHLPISNQFIPHLSPNPLPILTMSLAPFSSPCVSLPFHPSLSRGLILNTAYVDEKSLAPSPTTTFRTPLGASSSRRMVTVMTRKSVYIYATPFRALQPSNPTACYRYVLMDASPSHCVQTLPIV